MSVSRALPRWLTSSDTRPASTSRKSSHRRRQIRRHWNNNKSQPHPLVLSKKRRHQKSNPVCRKFPGNLSFAQNVVSSCSRGSLSYKMQSLFRRFIPNGHIPYFVIMTIEFSQNSNLPLIFSGKTFENERLLSYHQNWHKGLQPYVCDGPDCVYRSHSKIGLQKHNIQVLCLLTHLSFVLYGKKSVWGH